MSNSKQRIISTIILILILTPTIFFGGIYFLVVAIAIAALATFELMNMFYKQDKTLKAMRFVVPVFSVILVVLVYLSETMGDNYQILLNGTGVHMLAGGAIFNHAFLILHIAILIAFLIFIVIILIIAIFTEGSGSHFMTSCMFALTYGGLFIAAACGLEWMETINNPGNLFAGRIFATFYLITVSTDMLAYLFGKRFGKHKLCPTISPKKSIEGAVAGLVGGTLIGVLCAWIFKVMPIYEGSSTPEIIASIVMMFCIAMLISIFSQLGDLIASKLKRSYDLKDYGTLLPGHGGIMDRFDSVIFSGAMLYVILLLIEIIVIGVM